MTDAAPFSAIEPPIEPPIEIALPDLAATRAIGARLGRALRPGDAVLLAGDLGAGKSELARAALRAALDDPELAVPSPTFTLIQGYEAPAGFEILHVDLYRLEDPEEVVELGLEEIFADSACLIEWPDRLGGRRPADALSLDLALADETEADDATPDGPRRLRVEAAGARWTERLRKILA